MSRVPREQDYMRQQLEDVIKTSTSERLKTVLRDICNESPKAFQLACDKLLVDGEQVAQPAVPLLGPLTRKRRRESTGRRYEICKQCEQEYDVLKEETCVWHEGEWEIDYDDDTWADWDERCHGPMNTKENFKAYPKGFLWTCCEEEGDDEGCMTGPHQPRDLKRSKIENPGGDSSSQDTDSDTDSEDSDDSEGSE